MAITRITVPRSRSHSFESTHSVAVEATCKYKAIIMRIQTRILLGTMIVALGANAADGAGMFTAEDVFDLEYANDPRISS